MSDPESAPQAVERRSRWPGWIWSIPIAALGIVIWLAVRNWASSGPKVTVIFPAIADLKPDDTQVKFRNMNVGQVESVKVEADLRRIRVILKLNSDMKRHLGKGTRFWIEGGNLSLANLSSIKTIISGPYISMEPAPGSKQKLYTGLTEAPVLRFGEHGTTFLLHCEKVNGIQHATPIYYLDQEAGEVSSYRMNRDHTFDITAVIKAPFDRLVHTGTRFWNAGAISLSTGANGPRLRFRSISALAQGAIAFDTPQGAVQGPTAKAYSRFELYNSQDDAENAPDPRGVAYQVVFTGVSSSLRRYAPVQLMGTRIGSVSDARLEYSPATGKLSIRATLVLEPSRIHLATGATWSDRPRRQMDAMLERLIAAGLRATLATSPPVIGGQMVVLEMTPAKTAAALIPGEVPEIPTAGGSDVSHLLEQANDIERKIDEMPLRQIAESVNRSAANLEHVSSEAREQLPAALKSARESILEAQAALSSAQNLLSSGSAVSNQPYTADVPQALYEMTAAARSLRELSDFIDRHPEALIRGRGDSQ